LTTATAAPVATLEVAALVDTEPPPAAVVVVPLLVVVEFEKPPANPPAAVLLVTTLVLVLTGVTTDVLVELATVTLTVELPLELPLVLLVLLLVTVGVMLILPPVAAARAEEYCTHNAFPTDWAAARSAALHAEMRHPAPLAAMAACPVGAHWQATSVGAQPAALMAETRQGEAQAGSPERFCAAVRRVRARRTVEKKENCIVA